MPPEQAPSVIWERARDVEHVREPVATRRCCDCTTGAVSKSLTAENLLTGTTATRYFCETHWRDFWACQQMALEIAEAQEQAGATTEVQAASIPSSR
ncbi:MAG: hypothetical protein JWO59_675 [Chloroflexi bacterium]|nr:hypothetical protein [Chloroflexota bacterium]